MTGYSDAFDHLIWGNYTDAVTTGYVHGAQMGEIFYIFLIFLVLIPVYLKTESYVMTGLAMMVLGASGLFVKISGLGGSMFGGINFTALFAILIAFGLAIPLFILLGRRE